VMSLRLRLSLTLGAAFALIWALAAAWMLSDLRNQMMFSLDQRLVASARMVAGLMEQLPPVPSKGEGTHFSAEQLNIPGGMACQVSSLRGEILARSHTDPGQALEAEKMGFHDQMIDGAPWRSFTLARGDLRITTADRQIEREALNMSILLAASVPVGVALLGCLCLLWLGIGQGSGAAQPHARCLDAAQPRLPGAFAGPAFAQRTATAAGHAEPIVPAHRQDHRA
jgi:two-component system sensor histidine kinase QseC